MGQYKETLPGLGKFVLWLFLDDVDYDQAIGDFEESYLYRIRTQNKSRARFWFWSMLMKSLPGFINDYFYWRGTMIRNYLKTAMRVIKKQKLFSFLNILGLAVSLTCALLILFHVKDELSYEKNFPKSMPNRKPWEKKFRSIPSTAPILEIGPPRPRL